MPATWRAAAAKRRARWCRGRRHAAPLKHAATSSASIKSMCSAARRLLITCGMMEEKAGGRPYRRLDVSSARR